MARRQFEVIDVVELLQHWHAGRPKSVVASSLGIDAKTVRKYVGLAEEAGLAPGGPPLGRAEWAELVRGWCPGLVDARARSLTFPVIDAHRERIGDMLATNTVSTVHQRLRDEHGLAMGISSFRLYVAAEFPDNSLRDRVTVMRPPVPPGEEAQIDYGHTGPSLQGPLLGTSAGGHPDPSSRRLAYAKHRLAGARRGPEVEEERQWQRPEERIVLVEFPRDPGLIAVLQELGIGPQARLGRGGEAWVYALDEERVVRVLHQGGRPDAVRSPS
jgi:hypothetical protein